MTERGGLDAVIGRNEKNNAGASSIQLAPAFVSSFSEFTSQEVDNIVFLQLFHMAIHITIKISGK